MVCLVSGNLSLDVGVGVVLCGTGDDFVEVVVEVVVPVPLWAIRNSMSYIMFVNQLISLF